jgi:hypothetical protein
MNEASSAQAKARPSSHGKTSNKAQRLHWPWCAPPLLRPARTTQSLGSSGWQIPRLTYTSTRKASGPQNPATLPYECWERWTEARRATSSLLQHYYSDPELGSISCVRLPIERAPSDRQQTTPQSLRLERRSEPPLRKRHRAAFAQYKVPQDSGSQCSEGTRRMIDFPIL